MEHNRKISTKGLIIIALLLASLTGFFVYNYLGSMEANAVLKGDSSVVIAKKNIPAKTQITADMVEQVKIPGQYLQPGAMVEASKVLGVIAKEDIIAGEQVTERLLVLSSKSVGFTGMIPRDKRALSITVDMGNGVAGLIKPGDYIDLLATFGGKSSSDSITNIFLQDILVLAVDKDIEMGSQDKGADKGSDKKTVLTLAVSPDEAEQVTLAEEKGKLRVALRPYLPINPFVAATSISPRDFGVVSTSEGAPSNPLRADERADRFAQSFLPATGMPSMRNDSLITPVRDEPPSGRNIQVLRGTKAESVAVQ